MEFKLEVKKKTFKDKDGTLVSYASFETVIDGETFILKPLDDQRRLLNYLLRQKGFFKGE